MSGRTRMPTLVCTSVRTLIKVAAKRMTSYMHANVRRQMWVACVAALFWGRVSVLLILEGLERNAKEKIPIFFSPLPLLSPFLFFRVFFFTFLSRPSKINKTLTLPQNSAATQARCGCYLLIT